MTLRVEVSIIPFGDEDEQRIIDVFNISNITHIEGRGPNGEDCYVIERNDYKNYNEKNKRVFHKRVDGAIKLVEKVLEVINE